VNDFGHVRADSFRVYAAFNARLATAVAFRDDWMLAKNQLGIVGMLCHHLQCDADHDVKNELPPCVETR